MQYHIQLDQDLRRNPYKGKYFAFEGIDGCGKSTQVEKIKKYFEDSGRKVTITSEPQAKGLIQEVIRGALFSKIKVPARAYQNLYSADRAVNHTEIVLPALKRGEVVLTHRSFWSAVAYGVLDLGDEYDFSHAASILMSQGILSQYHKFLAPYKTFYLQISVDHAVERLGSMGKTKDIYENSQKLAKIVTGYKRVIAKFPDEFVIIDGEQDENKVTKDIIEHLTSNI